MGKVADAIKLLEANESGTGAGRAARASPPRRVPHRERAPRRRGRSADEDRRGVQRRDDRQLRRRGARDRRPRRATCSAARRTRTPRSTRASGARQARSRRSLWRAELFLDKYDPGHAERGPRARRSRSRRTTRALLVDDGAREARGRRSTSTPPRSSSKEALAVNPKLTAAFAVRARARAARHGPRRGRRGPQRRASRSNPNDLELLSLRAATRFLADDRAGYEAAKKEVLARNARVLARCTRSSPTYAEWEHRYDDIVAMMKEAVAARPRGRQGVGRARAHRDARRRRDGRARGAPAAPGRRTTSTSASSTR